MLEEPLAIDGSSAVRTTPFPSWPHISEPEVEAAAKVLRSGRINYWTGDEGRKFEEEYAKFVGSKHAIVLANGTVALELALFALGIGKGDEVIVTPRSFIASASCAVMRGATPIFADICPDSQNITAESIAHVITPRTRAIIAVHLAGWPCEMDSIMQLAERHGISVIEDCAQAHGALFKGRQVGSFGHIGAFSFCQDKIITTGGEGGMVVTNDERLWKVMWSFKDHGKGYDAVYCEQHPPGFRWLHRSFGTNWRLTEMQSAMGRVALARLSTDIQRRKRNAELLTRGFADLSGLRIPPVPEYVSHSFYKYYVFVRPERLKNDWTRDRIMEAILAEGVPCFQGSCSEMYLEGAFTGSLRPAQRLPVAKQLGETSLMFLVHPTLHDQDMLDVVSAVRKVLTAAGA